MSRKKSDFSVQSYHGRPNYSVHVNNNLTGYFFSKCFLRLVDSMDGAETTDIDGQLYFQKMTCCGE